MLNILYRIYPLNGFGLPAGGTLEEVIEPEVERIEPELSLIYRLDTT